MKRVLLVGDSLATGMPPVNFPMLLKDLCPGFDIKASGVGGDTLLSVCERTNQLLQGQKTDVLIIEAGANDILLPVLKKRGGKWKWLVRRIEGRGSVPVEDAGEFAELYREAIRRGKEFVEEVIATTITCIGEDLESEPNQRRAAYNATIRGIAESEGIRLADAGEAFDVVLRQLDRPGNYLLDKFSGLFLDTWKTVTARGADSLSAKRGLVLTIDGVHLGRRGARLFAQSLSRVLR